MFLRASEAAAIALAVVTAASCRRPEKHVDAPPAGPPVVTSVKGTVVGKAIEFTHVTAGVGYLAEDGTPIDALLEFSRDPEACKRSNEVRLLAGSDRLVFRIKNASGKDGSPARLQPGTYRRVPPWDGLIAFDGLYFRFDDLCKPTLREEQNFVISGSVTVNRLELAESGAKGYLEGTLSIRVGEQGDVVSGAFRAEVCKSTRPALTGADLGKPRPPPRCDKSPAR
jgi:hypothetical protein